MSQNTYEFKIETLNLSKIYVFQSLDRANGGTRAFPSFPRNLSTVSDQLFCPRIWKKPNVSLGYNQTLKLKAVRIYDSLCSSTGVRTYFYKMVGSELAFMYQKRPIPQDNFIVFFPNLTHMFNDAIGLGNANINVYKDQRFDISNGVSRYSLQNNIIAYAKKSKRALSISETTRGTLGGSEDKYNIFIRNHPRLDGDGKQIKCKKKIFVLEGKDTKVGQKIAFYSGECYAPVEVKHHECRKLISDDHQISVTFDIFILYSVDQDMYTVYKPNGLNAFEFNHNGRFDGIFINKELALTHLNHVIDLEQKALDSKARSNQLTKERNSKVV